MKHKNGSIKAVLLIAGMLASSNAWAFESKPFTPALFSEAKTAGKPILLEVTAPWCPTCRVQKTILSDLKSDPKLKNYTVLEIDFDSQTATLRDLKVLSQSTLIVYKNGNEVGRSTGDTSREGIKALLDSAI